MTYKWASSTIKAYICLLQADFAQNKTAAASQRPLEAPKQPQQLGTTRLGRQRLQQKADSFAGMVHLVSAADEKPADATNRPEV